MSNKWQVIMLGVVIVQGAGLGAMENKTPNSPRRNPLGCSAEVRKDVTVEALKRSIERKNSGDLSKEAKYASNAYYPWPGANPVYDIHPRRYNQVDYMKPYTPDYFPH